MLSICYIPGAALVVVVNKDEKNSILNLEDTTMHNNDIIFFTDNSGKIKIHVYQKKNLQHVWVYGRIKTKITIKKQIFTKFVQYI